MAQSIAQTELAANQGTPASTVSWTDNQGTLHAVIADILVQFVATYEGSLTEHPRMAGSPIADHWEPRPPVLALTLKHSEMATYEDGVNTMQPLTLSVAQNEAPLQSASLALQAGASAIFGKARGPLVVEVLQGPSGQARVRTLLEDLEAAWLNGYPVTIVVKEGVWEGYTLTSVKYTQDADEYGTFDLTVKRIDTVEVAYVGADALPKPADLRMSKAKKGGKSTGKTPKDAEANARKTDLITKLGLNPFG